MNGVIYTRVSSDEQVAGTSLAMQEELCRRYCDQNGIAIVAIFKDEGESAKNLSLNNRSQFLAALDFCRKRKDIGAFVVFRVDRFARNTEDHFSVKRVLLNSGTTLRSVTEPIGNKPAEKFIETVLAGAAEYDNDIRKQRCIDGMASRIGHGIWPWKPPVGYVCGLHRQRGEKKTVPDQAHPVLFPIIQRALRAYASGEIVSQIGLANQLNAWGFAAAHGRKALPSMVDRMLGQYLPFYAGILINPWTEASTLGIHVPMITKAEMTLIQARRRGLAPDAPTQRTRYHPTFRLRRLLTCASCGRFLTACYSKGRNGTYGYYYCINKQCKLRSRTIRHTDVATGFLALLRRLVVSPAMIERALDQLEDVRQEKSHSRPEDIKKREQTLLLLNERRRRLHEMREDGTYDANAFRERLLAVDAEIASLTISASPSDLGSIDPEVLRASARWFLEHLTVIWEKLPEASRSRFERIAFPNGIQYDPRTRFRTAIPGPILAVLSADRTSKSRGVLPEGISSNQLCESFKELIAFYYELKDVIPNKADTAQPPNDFGLS